MENNKVKNTIVLKGMASNVIDEAIVILKPHVKIKKTQGIKKIKEKSFSKEIILKEAENTVSEYVNRLSVEELKREKNKLEKKMKKMKFILFSFLILLIVVVILK